MRRKFLLVGTVTLILLAALGAGAYVYFSGAPPSEPEELPEEPATLYFVHRDDNKLATVERTLSRTDLKSQRVREILAELSTSPTGDSMISVVPEELKVNSVFFRKQTVVLDFNEALIGAAEGTSGEMLLLYSIVNSVLANLPDRYKLVQFLINGEMRKTIGAYGESSGHVAIMYPLGPRWDSLVR